MFDLLLHHVYLLNKWQSWPCSFGSWTYIVLLLMCLSSLQYVVYR